MATNLDPIIREILIFLADQHQSGAISVSTQLISDQLGVSAADITAAIQRLKQLRLLDELEEKDQACLSATGFRLARSAKEQGGESSVSFENAPSTPAAEAQYTKDDSASTLLFLARLQDAVRDELPDVLESASISPGEREKLQKLAQEFFSHPASFELLRRALSRLR